MSKITIFHINGSEIFSHECEENTIKITVEEAVKQGVSLAYANLNGANLDYAILNGANLNCANLNYASLNYVNLHSASLMVANLYCAIFNGTILIGADLNYANLNCAILNGVFLNRANLKYAYLNGAILDGEVLSSKTPISLPNLKWDVLITDNFMLIGCERHTHSEWENFSDEEISKMAEGASEFWKQWKGVLIGMCKVHSS